MSPLHHVVTSSRRRVVASSRRRVVASSRGRIVTWSNRHVADLGHMCAPNLVGDEVDEAPSENRRRPPDSASLTF